MALQEAETMLTPGGGWSTSMWRGWTHFVPWMHPAGAFPDSHMWKNVQMLRGSARPMPRTWGTDEGSTMPPLGDTTYMVPWPSCTAFIILS